MGHSRQGVGFGSCSRSNGLPPYDLIVEGETVRMAPAEEAPAHVTLRCEAATFMLLMCGRRPLDTLVAEGRVVLTVIMGFSQPFVSGSGGCEPPRHGLCAGVQQAAPIQEEQKAGGLAGRVRTQPNKALG